MSREFRNFAATALAFASILAWCSAALSQAPVQDAAKPNRGRDRWAVKTASDPDAAHVKTAAIQSTIEKLLALPRPADMPLSDPSPKYQTKRAEPVETSVYAVEADVVDYRLMPDGDYRVTIKGASGQSMELEMPNPDPAFVDPASPFAYAIKSAREQFDAKYHPEKATKQVAAHARITGIGFFARAFGKSGKQSGNLVQLHPVLDIQWLDRPTTQFSTDAAKSKAPDGQTQAPGK